MRHDVKSLPDTGSVIWKDKGSWGAPCEKGKERGKSLQSDGDRSHESMIHIPKSLHAPRKSLKVPGSQAKKESRYTVGLVTLWSWREPSSWVNEERHRFALFMKWLEGKSVKKRQHRQCEATGPQSLVTWVKILALLAWNSEITIRWMLWNISLCGILV